MTDAYRTAVVVNSNSGAPAQAKLPGDKGPTGDKGPPGDPGSSTGSALTLSALTTLVNALPQTEPGTMGSLWLNNGRVAVAGFSTTTPVTPTSGKTVLLRSGNPLHLRNGTTLVLR
ncbi:MAG: hypothetical protein JWP29_3531 [Rhodoferax sp.]|nr:hypothetical protein [Rhodoferax sp.]